MADWVKDHWAKAAVGGLGGGAGLMFLARDAIKEWWGDRRESMRVAREERKAAREDRARQGFSDKLANELLAILREDLKGNAMLLKELAATLSEFRDVMRIQSAQGAEIMTLARETRESQKWLERKYGGGGGNSRRVDQ